MKNKNIIVNLIPTGIKCSIGGYIGDATYITNKLANACDYLITNPNAVNAGAFNFKEKNVLYVEGYAIDELFQDKIGLRLSRQNPIGVIIENNRDRASIAYTFKAIEAFRNIAGIKIINTEIIPSLPKKIKFQNKQFCADINKIDCLLIAAKKLKQKGAKAIAIATHINIPKKFIRKYQSGLLPNPYGLLESLLSHSITAYLNMPAAHAPVLTKKEMEFYLFKSFKSDSRSSFENICSAYIGSILIGLSDAPLISKKNKADIKLSDIKCLIIPNNCLRSIPVAKAIKSKIPIFQIEENKNIFTSLANNLNKDNKIINLKTYNDAVKIIASWPKTNKFI